MSMVHLGLYFKLFVSSAETAMHLAASSGCHELVTLLLRSGAEVDPEDDNGTTPLMMATISSNPHCVHELLIHGADISRRNVNDDTAYSLAVKHGARNCQTVLENHMLSVMGQPRV